VSQQGCCSYGENDPLSVGAASSRDWCGDRLGWLKPIYHPDLSGSTGFLIFLMVDTGKPAPGEGEYDFLRSRQSLEVWQTLQPRKAVERARRVGFAHQRKCQIIAELKALAFYKTLKG